ncbi:MAG: hypothetical protein AAF602_05745 [Myxococcota bacterium]
MLIVSLLVSSPAAADVIQLEPMVSTHFESSEGGGRLHITGTLVHEGTPATGHGGVVVASSAGVEGWVGEVLDIEVEGNRATIVMHTPGLGVFGAATEGALEVHLLSVVSGEGIWGTDGVGIWGTNGAAVWGSGGIAIWGTNGVAVWGDTTIRPFASL